MKTSEKLLSEYSDREKGAYLGAIASIATADRIATDEEIEFMRALAETADLSEQQEESVIRAAKEMSGDELRNCLDILKSSDLRFSLITDIMSFANTDGKYSEEEKRNIEQMAKYLNINQQQFSLLDLFVKKTNETSPQSQEVTQPGFLERLGLNNKFKDAGINSNSLTKGLLGILGPMVLAKMLTGGLSRNKGFNTNMLNSRLGNRNPLTGAGGLGLGSLISLLNSGRGYNSMGNLIPKLFGPQSQSSKFK